MRKGSTWFLIGNLSLTVVFALTEFLLIRMPDFTQYTANSGAGKLALVPIGLYFIGTPILSGFSCFRKGLRVSTGVITGLLMLGWAAHIYWWLIRPMIEPCG